MQNRLLGDVVRRVDIDSVLNYSRTFTTDSWRSPEIPEILEIILSYPVVPGSKGRTHFLVRPPTSGERRAKGALELYHNFSTNRANSALQIYHPENTKIDDPRRSKNSVPRAFMCAGFAGAWK
eukprot:674696-Amorphochlora_amoeboformis.AAC.1